MASRGRKDSAPTAPTATASVAEALAQLIIGEMSPGTSLPSESVLAERFEVSRLTVREAVKMLAGRGLLDVGRGRRAIVREPTAVGFSDFLSAMIRNDPKALFDLIEFRMSLEVQSASLAARRAGRAGITALEMAVEGMREASAEGKAGLEVAESERRFHASDLGFHEAIALSSGNRLISFLFEAMSAPLEQSFMLSRRGHDMRGRTVDDTIDEHVQIFTAIRDGNTKAAAAAMREHLQRTEHDIRAALNTVPNQPIVWASGEEP